MSLVGRVGRRRWRARFAMGLLYLVLFVGALTTLYPFCLMLTTGFKGATDQNDNRLIPTFWTDVESYDGGKLRPESLLGKYLDDKYSGDLSAVASVMSCKAGIRRLPDYTRFLESLPVDFWSAAFLTPPNQVTGKLTMRYQAWLRSRYGSIEELNRAYLEENVGFQTVAPPNEQLDNPNWRPKLDRKRREWLVFKSQLPAEYRIPIRAERMFQKFLASRYQGQFALVPESVRGGAHSFEEIKLPKRGPVLDEFAKTRLPFRFKDQTVEGIWSRWANGEPMPLAAFERKWVSDHIGEIRHEFTIRNFKFVLDYLLINGRAVFNTVVFCLLMIILQLTVNPLAAYAIFRYPIKATGKILIFLLATMAFPAEVAMIPSFLLLKDLGLLNTFAALVLPAAASGYMIFLLKGFFDSLPQEIFDSGQIDGAKEVTMMSRIALPLSKPVLGYLALLAFMGAYGAFMYAFLVAQDRRMWTLMVSIYQLQLFAPKAVMMAALTLAALPTLLVFLMAQRVIMRGIVLPGER